MSDDPDLIGVPAADGMPYTRSVWNDPRTLSHADGVDTEHEAAAANQAGKAVNRLAVLRVFAIGPVTTHGAAWLVPQLDLTETRRRATDLLNAGLLERTGDTRILPTGRSAHVLRITEAGRAVLKAMEP